MAKKEFKGTKGTWKIGIPGTVVSDSGDNAPKNTGHDDTEYYGGYLVCESIASKADAQLISASPDLLEALQDITKAYKETVKEEWGEPADWSNFGIPEIDAAEKAINKALNH